MLHYKTGMGIKSFLTLAKQLLKGASIPSHALDAELLLAHVLQTTREKIIGYPNQELTPAQQEAFEALITRRANREPMAHILGKREFWGREFKVTKDTLDPRPDSETLIETVLNHYKAKEKPQKILDLGTGTGCLVLTLLAEFPGAAGVGVDLNPGAIKVANANAMHLRLEKHVDFLLQCWAEGITDKFDVIISNPPYIRDGDINCLEPEVSHYEPRLALAGGEDGLHCYRELIPQLAELLSADGIVVLEYGMGQTEDVSAILRSNNLEVIGISCDLAGVERCVTAAKKGYDS